MGEPAPFVAEAKKMMMRMTDEYVGGLLAGFGLGIEPCGYFVVGDPFLKTEWFIAGFVLIGIGTIIA